MPDLLEGVKPKQMLAAYMRAVTPKVVPHVDLYHVGAIKANVSDALAELIDELPRIRRISFRHLTADLVDRLEVIVRFLALRKKALSLAKSCSIGLRSGEYGGR